MAGENQPLSEVDKLLAASGIEKPDTNTEERSLISETKRREHFESPYQPKRVTEEEPQEGQRAVLDKEDPDEADPVDPPAKDAPVDPAVITTVDPVTGKPVTPADPATTVPAAMTDEEFLAELAKRTGRDIKSLDEIKTPAKELSEDEKRAQSEQRRSKAIEFGKSNNVFSQADYDNYVKFSTQTPIDVVRKAFIENVRSADALLTEKEAVEMFDDFYHQHDDEDPKHKQATALIQQQYDAMMRRDYGKIMDIESVYETVEKDTQRATEYKAQVDQLFASKLPSKFEFTIEGEKVSFPINLTDKATADILAGIKSNYLTLDAMQAVTGPTGKVDESALLSEIEKDVKISVLEKMVKEVATAYSDIQLRNARLGRKAVVQLPEAGSGEAKRPLGAVSEKLMAEAGMLPD